MIDIVRIGERIAALRRESGLSQEELAAELYVTRQAVSKWERGVSAPPLEAIEKMTHRFGVSVDCLLCLGEDTVADPEDIFRGHSREYVLAKIEDGSLGIDPTEIFDQLTMKERARLLHFIKLGAIPVNRSALYERLTPSEQKFLGGYYDEICQGHDGR